MPEPPSHLSGGVYPERAAELRRMAEADQAMRRSGTVDSSADREHARRLKEIIQAIGWPTTSKVGQEASHQAWLLAQHADHDPAFQQECLRLMQEAPEGEVQQSDLAYLEDRVRVNGGRLQLYGTQFHVDEHGEYHPRPIEDPERLDERRRAAGLEPFAHYRATLIAFYQELLQTWRQQPGPSGSEPPQSGPGS